MLPVLRFLCLFCRYAMKVIELVICDRNTITSRRVSYVCESGVHIGCRHIHDTRPHLRTHMYEYYQPQTASRFLQKGSRASAFVKKSALLREDWTSSMMIPFPSFTPI